MLWDVHYPPGLSVCIMAASGNIAISAPKQNHRPRRTEPRCDAFTSPPKALLQAQNNQTPARRAKKQGEDLGHGNPVVDYFNPVVLTCLSSSTSCPEDESLITPEWPGSCEYDGGEGSPCSAFNISATGLPASSPLVCIATVGSVPSSRRWAGMKTT